jgi:general secretion pathway protein I
MKRVAMKRVAMQRVAMQRVHRRPRGTAQRGFTLIEVMLALSILAITLIGLISRTSANIRLTQEAGMLDVATELARSKMFDIEAELLHDGFPEMNEDDSGDFSDQGWPAIEWETTIEKIELPNLTAMQSLQEGEGEGEAEAEAGEAGGGMLGGLMGEAGGMGAGFIASQFELITQVLEVSIRKVTLTVRWTVGQERKEMVVATYFTDPVAMGKVIPGLGSPGGGGTIPGVPGTGTGGGGPPPWGGGGGGGGGPGGGGRGGSK